MLPEAAAYSRIQQELAPLLALLARHAGSASMASATLHEELKQFARALDAASGMEASSRKALRALLAHVDPVALAKVI